MGTRYPEIFLKPSSLLESHRVLKNDQLRRARQNAQSEALTNFLLAYMGASRQGHNPETCLQKAWEEIADIIEGKTPYSAAVLDCINLHCQTLGKS